MTRNSSTTIQQPPLSIWRSRILNGLILLGIAFNFWQIHRPPADDAAEWLIAANGILHGRIPYQHYFLHVGPLTSYLLSVVFFLTMNHVIMASLFFVGVNCFTAYGCYRLLSLHHRRHGLLAALFYLWTIPFLGGSEMYVESLAALCGIWGFVFFLENPTSTTTTIKSTVLFFLAFMTKQTALIYFLSWGFIHVFSFINPKTEQKKIHGMQIINGVFIFLLCFSTLSIYFVKHGAFDKFIYDFFIWNFVGSGPAFQNRSVMIDVILGVCPWLFLFSVLSLINDSIWNRWQKIFLFFPIVLSILHTIHVPHFHYLLLGLPFLCVTAAIGYRESWRKLKTSRSKILFSLLMFVLLLPTWGRTLLALIRPVGIPPMLMDLLKKTPVRLGVSTRHSLFLDIKNVEQLHSVIAESDHLYTNYNLYYYYLNQEPVNGNIYPKQPISWSAAPYNDVNLILNPWDRNSQTCTINEENLNRILHSWAGYNQTTIDFPTGQISRVDIYRRKQLQSN